jgi:hypothetical protein
MTAANQPLGPGTLTLGEIGTPVDASCLVNKAKITMEKDQKDPKTKLCGDVSAAPPKYAHSLTGNVDQDLATTTGLHALSWSAAGTEIPFTFTPNTDVGATATGTLVIDPLDFGGDEMGEDMTSDFTWSIVGTPAIVYGTGAAAAALVDDELVDDELVEF